MTTLAQRNTILELVDDAVGRGARYKQACQVIGIAASTLRRWRSSDGCAKEDGRPTAVRPVVPTKNWYSLKWLTIPSPGQYGF